MRSLIRSFSLILLLLSLIIGPVLITGCGSITNLISTVDITSIDSEILILIDGTLQLTEIYQVSSPQESWGLKLVRPKLRTGEVELSAIGIAASGLNPTPIYTQLEQEVKRKLKNSPAAYEKIHYEDRTTVQMHTNFGKGEWLIKVEWIYTDAIVQNADKALLYAPLLSLDTNSSPDIFTATMILPERITGVGANAVTQTSANITVNRLENNLIKLRTEDLEPDDKLWVLLSTDADIFTALEPDPAETTYEQQFQQAGLSAQKMLKLRQRAELIRMLIPYITLVSLILALAFYIYYEREGFSKAVSPNFALWPSSVKPYNSSMLLKQNTPGRILLSSMLSLVNQKELWLDDYVFTWPHSGRVDFSSLRPSETYLLHWLFQDLAIGGPALSAAQLRRAASDSTTAKSFKQNYQEFEQLICDEYLELGLYDQGKTKFGRILTIIFTVVLAILAPILSLLGKTFYGFLLLLPAASFLFLCLGVRHLTQEGQARLRECREYAKNLDNISLLAEATDSQYSLTETAILALPRAVAIDRVNLFFDGLYELSDYNFVTCAHALLHIYLRTPLPKKLLVSPQEKERLWQKLNDLREILLSSATIITSGF